MHILIIHGSGRKNGNTARMLELFQEQLQLRNQQLPAEKRQAFKFERINLIDKDVQPCLGCRTCFDKGMQHCPLQDDIPAIYKKMQRADVLIVASPVYVGTVSGLIKNWIDRLAFVCHRPEFAGRTAFILTTVGSFPISQTERMLQIALGTWGWHVAGKAVFTAGALSSREELARRYRKKITRTAGRLLRDLERKKADRPSFLNLMTFRIQQKSWHLDQEEGLDLEWWRRHGWLDKGVSYYIPHRASWVKTRLARGVGSVIGLFVAD